MRIEGVVDAAAPLKVEMKSQRIAARLERLLAAVDVDRGRAVFLRDVLDDVLPFRCHLRIELERLEVKVGAELRAQARQGGLQRFQSDRAPRTGNIGDEIDLHGTALECAAGEWG